MLKGGVTEVHMNKPDRSLSQVRVIYLATTIFLVALSIYAYTQIKNLIAASERVNHTNLVTLSLQKIKSNIIDAETNQQGYLLTDDSFLLNNRDIAFHNLAVELNKVDSLTRDNPEQIENLKTLHAAINAKLLSMQEVLHDYRTRANTDEFKTNALQGVVKMDNVKRQISIMSAAEEQLLKWRTRKYTRLSFITPLFIIVLFLGALLILFASYFRINNELHHSQKLQARIEETNKQLEKQNEHIEERRTFVETLINASVDIILVVDKELRYLSANKCAVETYAKFYKGDIIGKKVLDVLPHSPVEGVEKALKGETVFIKKYKAHNNDQFYELTYIPLYKRNEVYAVMIISHDISEIIKTEDKIRTLNQTHQYAEQVGLFGSYRYNFATQKLSYSDNLYRLLGCEPNEFEAHGDNFIKFIHPDDVEFVAKATSEAFNNKQISKWEYRVVRKDGQLIHVRGTGKIITDDEGVQLMIGTLQDISEETRKENILKQSEEKFNKLFQFAPFSITLSEVTTGKLIDANESFIKTFGYSREELIGRTTLELNLIDSAARAKVIEQLMQQGSVRNIEFEVTKKTGEKIPVLVSIEQVMIGNQQYFLNAITDIIDRKKAEEEIHRKNDDLERMNKELQAFAYISSHDLQEPLRKIQTYALRILDKDYDTLSESAKGHFNRMQDAARRMQTLIEDLLAYSRTGKAERNFENTDLSKILEEVKEELKEDLKEKHATIEASDMCIANVIPFQFRQLMHNLIGNSLKFSKPGNPPYIKIKSSIIKGDAIGKDKLPHQKKYCHISIADNGIGFEPQYSEKIFEVFQRLHGKGQYNGTGIGLSIVKKIVENHDGIITASSELNKGATFDIYIPA